ncbi:hypothetical protein VSR34_06940 [Paraburkholderia sp. JHI2823]|uniref:hypothetical protein n=1 Tax=Paraburkholderia sp. JHI2823 TaxID=3112960 RepID=UPI00317D29F4
MRQSVLGVFDSYADARSAQRALGDAGMAQANIAVYSASVETPNGKGPRVYTPGGGDTRHHKPVFDQLEQLFGRLFPTGEYPPETEDYREFVRRGGTLVCADVSETEVDMAVEVMRRAGAADIDERANAWRHASTRTGMPEHGQQRSHPGERDDASQYEAPSAPSTASRASMGGASATGESGMHSTRFASGGPRTVGGMQQVTTKQTQERGSAEGAESRLGRGPDYGTNRGTDRGPNAGSNSGSNSGPNSGLNTGRNAGQSSAPGSGPNGGSSSDSGLNSSLNRSPDNGPNQSMSRERVGDPLMGTPLDDDPYESEFRRDYNAHYANTGASYDEYRRAYTHGAELGQDERYRGYDWQQVEPSAREDWESRYPASGWERFKAAVRHGWERVIGH